MTGVRIPRYLSFMGSLRKKDEDVMKELKPKLFSVMKDYTKEQFVKDVISGIIVAIIALPLSIALAIASGVSPEQGLYTAIFAGFFMPIYLFPFSM